MTKLVNHILMLLLVCLSNTSQAQNRMRPVEELVNVPHPGWMYVQQLIDYAKNKVEILSCDTLRAKEALYKSQVDIHSPMGAIIYGTGGLLVDGGWIRILGSGSSKLDRTLPDWNKEKSLKEFGEQPGFLLIADDAVGGFFALNGGELGKDLGNVYYLSPDNLKWRPLGQTYFDFLLFCLRGDLNEFYKGFRWNNWEEEVRSLDGNQVYNFTPCLWTKEGKDINKNERKIINVEEQYALNINSRKQLGLDKKKN